MEIIETVESPDHVCVFCECNAVVIPFLTVSEITGEPVVRETIVCPQCLDYNGIKRLSEGSEDD